MGGDRSTVATAQFAPRSRWYHAIVAGTVALVGLATSCGGGGDAAPIELSTAGEEGRSIFRTNGCNSCHGANGEGNIGPALADLFGTDVELTDGTTVVADRAYLVQSIMEPGAAKVAGFGLPMPQNELTADQVNRIVDYIVEIGPSPDGTSPTP